eukprot:scaffold442_cov123-Isochrysis_galbana.AAC.2
MRSLNIRPGGRATNSALYLKNSALSLALADGILNRSWTLPYGPWLAIWPAAWGSILSGCAICDGTTSFSGKSLTAAPTLGSAAWPASGVAMAVKNAAPLASAARRPTGALTEPRGVVTTSAPVKINR